MNIELKQLSAYMAKPRVEPSNEVELIELEPGKTDRTIAVIKGIPSSIKAKLVMTLRGYKDIFVWEPKDMHRISKYNSVHNLNINP